MSVIRSASMGPTGSSVSSRPSQQPQVAEVHVLAARDGELLRVPRGLDGREVRVGGLAEPIALAGLIVPEDEARCRQAGVPDVGPQGPVQVHRGGAPCVLAAGLECRRSAHRVADVRDVVEVECADRRRAGSQRLDDEGGIGDPHVRDPRGRGVPTGDVAQERWIDPTEGGRGHHVAVREHHEGGAGGVDADDRVAVAGQVLGQRRVGRDRLTEARQQHDHRRADRRAARRRSRSSRRRSGPGTRSRRCWRGPPRSAAGTARRRRTIPRRRGTRSRPPALGRGHRWRRGRAGPASVSASSVRPDRGRARDGRKRELLGHRDGAGGGDPHDPGDKADDEAARAPGQPEATGRSRCAMRDRAGRGRHGPVVVGIGGGDG